jgi:hypothetical protein
VKGTIIVHDLSPSANREMVIERIQKRLVPAEKE